MSNNKYLKFITLFLGLFILKTNYAQQNSGGVPMTFQYESAFYNTESNTNSITLPNINNNTEQQRADSIAAITCTDCNNQYYGRGLNVNINIKNQGQLEVLEDGSKLWLLKVESSTAYGMQFYFNKFKLPEGAKLFIYNEDRTMVLGAY